MSLELKETIDGIAKMVSDIQARDTELKGKNAETDTSIKNMQAALDSQLKEFETVKNELKNSEERSKRLEAIALRQDGAGSKKESNSDYNLAFKSYIRNRTPIDNQLTDSYIKSAIENEYKGSNSKDLDVHLKTLRSDIGPDGGYFIAPERGEIIKGRYFETTPMTQLATVKQITSNEILMPLDDNEMGDIEWTSQITAPSTTPTPQIGQVKLLANEVQAKVFATQSALDDMPNADSWLLEQLNDKFDRGLNTAYTNGDGADKPKGFLSYAAWSSPTTIAGTTGTYERNKIEQIASGVVGGLTVDGLRTLQSSLKENYQEGAVFLMKRMTWNNSVLSKDGVGQYLINPRFMKEGTDLTLLGRPVVFGNDMQAVAADALAVAYGNFKRGYMIVERLGLRILRDPYTSTPQVSFKAFKRVGGGVINFEAIKLLKLSA